MTYQDDSIPKPKRRMPSWVITVIGCSIICGCAFLIGMAFSSSGSVEPKISNNDTFQDTNQTRAELLQIIQNQRTAVYSSYPLEWAFCIDKLGTKDIASADRSDIRIQGQTDSSHTQTEHDIH